MNRLFERLLENGPVLTDGAWATQLQTLGLAIGECPDAWNVTHPDMVARAAEEYVAAGSRIILTNTFGANRLTLARHGLAQSIDSINRAGAAISRLAAGTAAFVFGSIGPCGGAGPTNDSHSIQLYSVYLEQADLLAESGVDALVLETMYNLDEARIALKAARSTGLPVVACMTYGTSTDPCLTLCGRHPEQVAEAMMEGGAAAIGANCGYGPSQMVTICARLKSACALPIWMKPNAGLPKMVEEKPVYHMRPADFAAEARLIVAAGASFIGGCCGAGPAHIAALQRSLVGGFQTRN